MTDLLALAVDAERDAWERLSLGYTETRGDPRPALEAFERWNTESHLSGSPGHLP